MSTACSSSCNSGEVDRQDLPDHEGDGFDIDGHTPDPIPDITRA